MKSDSRRVAGFSLDSTTGRLKIKMPEDKADTLTDILLLQALTRRSLAMDQANLVEYSVIQSWVDRLLRRRSEGLHGDVRQEQIRSSSDCSRSSAGCYCGSV